MKPNTKQPSSSTKNGNSAKHLLCAVEIEVYNMFPMERREHLNRYQATLTYMHNDTEITNNFDKRNKSVIRKSEKDAVDVAKKWKQQIESSGLKVRVQGLYVI